MKVKQALFSVCMIVKDEADKIEGCIKSILPFADEIIVNDTGSSDNTTEIAESLGAKVIHTEWKDDFSYSRNASIEQATGKWVMWLDADDTVPEESASKIMSLKLKKADSVYSIICRNRQSDGTVLSLRQCRIFPNKKGIFFCRAIHEQFIPSALEAGLSFKDTDIVVDHWGYLDAKTTRDKSKRNHRILLSEYEKGAKDPLSIYMLGESSPDKKEAEKWYREFINIPGHLDSSPSFSIKVYTELCKILNYRGSLEESEEYIKIILESSEPRPEILYVLAENLILQSRKDEAITVLDTLIGNSWDVGDVSLNIERLMRSAIRIRSDLD